MLDAATRTELRQRIDAARRARVAPPECKWGEGVRRGTHSGYAGGCHCRDCRDGEAEYKRDRRARGLCS